MSPKTGDAGQPRGTLAAHQQQPQIDPNPSSLAETSGRSSPFRYLSPSFVMLSVFFGAPTLGFAPAMPMAQSATRSRMADSKMLYGEPRPVQIIPSVLPADWANSMLLAL